MPKKAKTEADTPLGDDRARDEDARPKRPRRPRRGHYKPLYVPLLDAFEMAGVGPTKGHALINAGVLKTVRIGKRRHVTFESLERLDDDSLAG